MTIMVVDDNQNIRSVVKELLYSNSEFIECSSGNEAVEKFRIFHPDWVIMDIKMSKGASGKGINGIKAAEKIKKDNPEAKIIIITNFNDDNFRIAAKQAGVLKYILKENLTIIPEFIKEYDKSS